MGKYYTSVKTYLVDQSAPKDIGLICRCRCISLCDGTKLCSRGHLSSGYLIVPLFIRNVINPNIIPGILQEVSKRASRNTAVSVKASN